MTVRGKSTVVSHQQEVIQTLKDQMQFVQGQFTFSTQDTTSTFPDDLALPVHRWFRYSAGFSALWVRDLIEREKKHGRHQVLDPFAGSGTVVLEGENCQVESIGIESHPFVSRIAQAKLYWRE